MPEATDEDPDPPRQYTRVRGVRMRDELWDAAAEVAAAEGTDRSAMIRDCLERKINRFYRRQRRHHGRH